MTIEEQLNQKQEEIHNLQLRLKNKCDLLDKIKEWLKVELDISYLSPKTKKEALYDMQDNDPLCYGRYECAEVLLDFINDEERRQQQSTNKKTISGASFINHMDNEKKGESDDEVYWC